MFFLLINKINFYRETAMQLEQEKGLVFDILNNVKLNAEYLNLNEGTQNIYLNFFFLIFLYKN